MQSANDYQVGGSHYRDVPGEQHWDRAVRLRFDFFQYMITKYTERAPRKNGKQDVEKALHFCQKWLESWDALYAKKSDPMSELTVAVKADMQPLKDDLNSALATAQALERTLRDVHHWRRSERGGDGGSGGADGGDAHEAAMGNARDVDWLLNNVVLTPEGSITINGATYTCLQGRLEDYVMEGAFGDGRTLWTCVKCRGKLYTSGLTLPHAQHRCGEEKAVLHATASQRGSGNDSEERLCSKCGSAAVPVACLRDDCPHHDGIVNAFICCRVCKMLPSGTCQNTSCPHRPRDADAVEAPLADMPRREPAVMVADQHGVRPVLP